MPHTADSIRARIKAVDLTDRLQKHALGELKPPMAPTQITAAIALLNKVAPNLKSIDITSPENNRPTITIVNYTDITPEDLPGPQVLVIPARDPVLDMLS